MGIKPDTARPVTRSAISRNIGSAQSRLSKPDTARKSLIGNTETEDTYSTPDTSGMENKCVGNHYHDLSKEIREFIDAHVKEELKTLGILLEEDTKQSEQRTSIRKIELTNFLPDNLSQKSESVFKNSHSRLSSNSRISSSQNGTILAGDHYGFDVSQALYTFGDNTKQVSKSAADTYTLPREKSTLSNKKIDFIPAQSLAGQNRHDRYLHGTRNQRIQNGQLAPKSSLPMDRRKGYVGGRPLHANNSQAASIAFQRYKTIYQSGHSPSSHDIRNRARLRLNGIDKVICSKGIGK